MLLPFPVDSATSLPDGGLVVGILYVEKNR